jgi:class 3 adenylate cyclase
VRVERTLAFLDLCGFTAYTQAHGDDAAVAVLARLRAVVRAATEQRGVRITRWLGDGVMLVGAETRAVLTCVSDVVAEMLGSGSLPIRGGIARGPVIMFEGDDYIGVAVNLAARLCDVAAPGEVLTATELTRFGTECLRRHVRLDGLDEPVVALSIAPA